MTGPAFSKSRKPVAVYPLAPGEVTDHSELPDIARTWAKTTGFDGQSQRVLLVPSADAGLACVLYGIGNEPRPMVTGKLASSLPPGHYMLSPGSLDPHLATLGWLLGGYEFNRYRDGRKGEARLVAGKDVDKNTLLREAEAVFLARDLINTPANDMGPEELEREIRTLARRFDASVSVTKGDALLKKNFPMIHAVGRASASAPRLIDLKWGKPSDPKVTLVGKGVVFDTGGLNIKPGNSMALMKKDMGGAANVVALAQMVMAAGLRVRLRLLVPAVENAISGNAFRPGDILQTRKGISVEIGNTDAEGRLVLGDALTLADEETPELLVDMATLTGAARVALGPELPPFYTRNEELAGQISDAAAACDDPLWRLPLWQPYQKMLSSKIADVNHISSGGFAGSVTAALFLSRFVERTDAWCHFDIYGWVPSAQPWAPVGGEAQGIRALYRVISQEIGK